ncbi:MAG: hypothetical protein BWY99_01692 [Synergistetes bacterium ADurb.BinA166]|nr:MAG: hypothetical protein BWY99_01692 [Synergistetes bacterium ADurb.BinA166]
MKETGPCVAALTFLGARETCAPAAAESLSSSSTLPASLHQRTLSSFTWVGFLAPSGRFTLPRRALYSGCSTTRRYSPAGTPSKRAELSAPVVAYLPPSVTTTPFRGAPSASETTTVTTPGALRSSAPNPGGADRRARKRSTKMADDRPRARANLQDLMDFHPPSD